MNKRITVAMVNERVDGIQSDIAEIKAQMAEILVTLKQQQSPAPEFQHPCAEAPAAPAKKKANTFKQDVIVARALRSPEEKAAARATAIDKAATKEAAATRRLEKALGLKANTLKNTLVSVAELADLGVKVTRPQLKEIKAEVRSAK